MTKEVLALGMRGAGATSRHRSLIGVDEPLTNDFLSIVDDISFESFVKEYGLTLFEPQLVRAGELDPGALSGRLKDGGIYAFYKVLIKPIPSWQSDIKEVMRTKAKGGPKFKAFVEMKSKEIVKEGVGGFAPDSGGYYFVVASDIVDACIVQIVLTDKPISFCASKECKSPYIQHDGRIHHCSNLCREVSRLYDEVAATKNRLRSRINRNTKLAPRTRSRVLKAIRETHALEDLSDVEESFGLQLPVLGEKLTERSRVKTKKAPAKKSPAKKKATRGRA